MIRIPQLEDGAGRRRPAQRESRKNVYWRRRLQLSSSLQSTDYAAIASAYDHGLAALEPGRDSIDTAIVTVP